MKPLGITKQHVRNAEKAGAENVFFDYEAQAIVLTMKNRFPYVILLENLNSTAELLDYVLQIQQKGWCTDRMLGDFFRMLEAICRVAFGKSTQGIFCPWSQIREGIGFKVIVDDGSIERSLLDMATGRGSY